MKKRYISIILLLVFLFACQNSKKQASTQIQPTPTVSYLAIKTQKITLHKELPGRVSAYQTAKIIPQVSGVILKRVFKEGAKVKKGDLLYIIDPRPYEVSLEKAKSSLKIAEARLPALEKQYKRYSKLIKTKSISQQMYDNTGAALDQLKAQISFYKSQIKEAKIHLNYCYIKAPIDGIIGRSIITEGAVVTAYQPTPLAIIQHFDPVYVDVPISTTELKAIEKKRASNSIFYSSKMDQQVKLILEDGIPYPQKGTLEFNEVTVDESTGSVILRIKFPNNNKTLLPGMFVRVKIVEGIAPKAILIPQEAVKFDSKGNPYVFTLNMENKVEVRPVQLDRAINNSWLISSGLREKDKVVVKGLQYIRPGVLVNPVPETSKR